MCVCVRVCASRSRAGLLTHATQFNKQQSGKEDGKQVPFVSFVVAPERSFVSGRNNLQDRSKFEFALGRALVSKLRGYEHISLQQIAQREIAKLSPVGKELLLSFSSDKQVRWFFYAHSSIR